MKPKTQMEVLNQTHQPSNMGFASMDKLLDQYYKIALDSKINENKKRIQKQIYDETGLKIDKVVLGKERHKQHWKCCSSRITRMDKEIFKNIFIAMICITSTKYKINVENFKIFFKKSARFKT